LVEAGVCELHLRLNPDRSHDPKPLGALGKVVQQRGLSDPRLAAHNHDTAVVLARVRQQPVERLGFAAPAPQLRPATVGVEHASGELISRWSEV
jgi:hypothetical protein